MKILIGNTGIIGKNLKEKLKFDYEFNSKNINDIEYCPDDCDLYLSCLPSTKWLVNKNIYQDLINIQNIISLITKKKYNNIFLFSSIDVYLDSPIKVNEDYSPNISELNYGSNRLLFEYMVNKFVQYNNFYIFRLPALFGKFLKKNVIYDLLNSNKVNDINLNSYYQWYNLDNLIFDLENLIYKNPKSSVFNLFTEPIYTEELVNLIFPEIDLNKKTNLIEYNWTTKYFLDGYLNKKEVVLNEIKRFIYEARNH